MTPESLSLLAGAGAALAVGAFGAQMSGPLSCAWPARTDVLMMRMLALRQVRIGKVRSVLGGALLASLLAGGTLTAYASQPGAPTISSLALAAKLGLATGKLVGSGDQLSSNIQPGQGAPLRSLQVSSEAKEGWTLSALTSDAASPAGVGQVRQANPDAAAQSATAVTAVAADQASILTKEIASGRWNGKPAWGLDQAQTTRLIVYDVKGETIMADWYSKNWVAGQMAASLPNRPSETQVYGADYADYIALSQRRAAYRVANFPIEMATPVTGPSSVYVEAGKIPREVLTTACADPRGTWLLGPADKVGGRTLSRVSTTSPNPGVVISAMAKANWGSS